MMGGFGAMGVGGLVWVLLLGLVVWAIIAASNRTGSATWTGSAQAILDERLARGELSVEEYRKLHEALR